MTESGFEGAGIRLRFGVIRLRLDCSIRKGEGL